MASTSPLDQPGVYRMLAPDDDATDLGRMIRCSPRKVVRPTSTDDVVEVIRACHGLGLPARARGPLRQMGGQQLTPGIAIDMCALNRIVNVDTGVIDAEAGATIREVVDAAWSTGQRLTSGPSLDTRQSIGDVLSAGGWSTVVREGSIADRCLGLELVTGQGERVWCSRQSNPDVFRVALGGHGAVGIITRAHLALCPVPPMARTWRRTYADMAELLEDMRTLSLREHVVDLHARWQRLGEYHLIATGYYHRKPPATGWVMRDLAPVPLSTSPHGRTYRHTVSELDDAAGELHRGWVPTSRTSMVLGAGVDEFVDTILADPPANSMGMLVPHVAAAFDRRTSLRLPPADSSGLVYLVDVLHGAQHVHPSQWNVWCRGELDRNRFHYERARHLGGELYPVGTTPLDGADERHHFGEFADQRDEVIARTDPSGIFGPWAALNLQRYAPDGITP
ncbi:FAD-binding oxidoreductase [Saccharopolyspora sp. K220]|uniref:FAD-binding oxidoreductase n=1 Tax=Saccharopolyspora soli TaxID=2926618 RepID=UPI001F58F25E|nr:FAD-binding oxidoreductase [Saccharopolyspora soli]MCI2422510.1 FAD-binding oxidoreductase [Saccharopolyspora soli]